MKLCAVVLDCPDVTELSRFYARLLGWEVTDDDGEWAMVSDPEGGTKIAFQLATDYQPPTWPDPGRPQMAHLDVKTDDMDAAERHALEVGATRYQHPAEDGWRVFVDPAGHPFCLT